MSKCEHLRIARQALASFKSSYSINGIAITPGDSVKYLGTVIDSSLHFDNHISNICKKADGILSTYADEKS